MTRKPGSVGCVGSAALQFSGPANQRPLNYCLSEKKRRCTIGNPHPAESALDNIKDKACVFVLSFHSSNSWAAYGICTYSLKHERECFIRYKDSSRRRESLYLIKHDLECFKRLKKLQH
ncbi:hypothetical protein AC249_AIPGENE9996 [Exaiptasia diaphana]|nr:hypothetical protein AC249_AIPGENE9996 [Exaiptasia diaphana]